MKRTLIIILWLAVTGLGCLYLNVIWWPNRQLADPAALLSCTTGSSAMTRDVPLYVSLFQNWIVGRVGDLALIAAFVVGVFGTA